MKPAVFPVPVCAAAITSLPFSTKGMACSWMGEGVSYPCSLTALRIGADKPSEAKPIDFSLLQHNINRLPEKAVMKFTASLSEVLSMLLFG